MDSSVKRNSLFLTMAVLVVYLVAGAPNGVTVGIAKLSTQYPQYPFTTVVLLSTIVSLTCLPTNMLFGTIVKKLGFKVTNLIGLVLFLLGGLIPFFLTNFWAILICRMVVGLGFGLSVPMGVSLASAYFKDETVRGRIIGGGNAFLNLGAMLFSLIGGLLVTIGIKYLWLVHLIAIIPFIFGLIMPEPELKDTPAEREAKGVDVQRKIPGLTWFFIIAFSIMMAFCYPYFLNLSSIVANEGIGTAVQVGTIFSMWNAGGFIGGFVFSFLMKNAKRMTFPLSALVNSAGLFLFFFSKTVLMMEAASFIAGLGWAAIMSYMYLGVSITAPASKIPQANGFMVLGNNLAMFFANYFGIALCTVFGKVGDLRFPILLYAIFMVICGIFFVFKPMIKFEK
ncbi:MAG: MFS transporter [Dehalobacter sp.]|nr:MFS transporter [Dehalobacter sp.]